MNTNDPTLRPPKRSQDKTLYDSRRRDHPNKKPWVGGGGGNEVGFCSLKPTSQGAPSQGAEPPSCMAGQTLTQIKPPKLPQQPEDDRPSGHFDCRPTPGVCLSVRPNFISYTPVNADRAGPFCFHFSFLAQNLPFPPS